MIQPLTQYFFYPGSSFPAGSLKGESPLIGGQAYLSLGSSSNCGATTSESWTSD
jgi:hypothetical protein